MMMVVVKMLLTMMKLVMRIVMNIGDGDDAGDLAEDDDAITPEVPVLCYQDLDPLGPDTKTLASNPETVEGFRFGGPDFNFCFSAPGFTFGLRRSWFRFAHNRVLITQTSKPKRVQVAFTCQTAPSSAPRPVFTGLRNYVVFSLYQMQVD